MLLRPSSFEYVRNDSHYFFCSAHCLFKFIYLNGTLSDKDYAYACASETRAKKNAVEFEFEI